MRIIPHNGMSSTFKGGGGGVVDFCLAREALSAHF